MLCARHGIKVDFDDDLREPYCPACRQEQNRRSDILTAIGILLLFVIFVLWSSYYRRS